MRVWETSAALYNGLFSDLRRCMKYSVASSASKALHPWTDSGHSISLLKVVYFHKRLGAAFGMKRIIVRCDCYANFEGHTAQTSPTHGLSSEERSSWNVDTAPTAHACGNRIHSNCCFDVALLLDLRISDCRYIHAAYATTRCGERCSIGKNLIEYCLVLPTTKITSMLLW